MEPKDITLAIQNAASRFAPAVLYEAVLADGCEVTKYADADQLQAALAKGRGPALAHALRAVARLDGEALVEVALVLAEDREGRSELTRAAPWALAHSLDDRALDTLYWSMHPALVRAAHPATTRRLWDAATASSTSGMAATMRLLGARSDDAAFRHARELLATHEDGLVTVACAEALAVSPHPQAVEVIDAHWRHWDSRTALACVTAALYRDVSNGYERFRGPIEATLGGTATPDQQRIVSDLLHAIRGNATPRSITPDPLDVDARFLDLAVSLHDHDTAGFSARSVLELVPRERVAEAIARQASRVATAPPPLTPTARAAHMSAAVAFMQRARAHFGEGRIATAVEIEAIVKVVGDLPVALEAFWRMVGSIELGIDDVIHGASDVMDQIDEYEDMIDASSREVVGRLPLDLGSYTIDLPPRSAEDAVDPPLYGDGPADGMRLMAFLQAQLP